MKRCFSQAPSAEGVSLRTFRIADYDPVVALWRRSEGVGLNESDTRPAISAYLRRNPGMSFVAEKNDRIIGAVLCGHDGRRGYLHHLAVSKQHRQRGVGRQLVNACLEKLCQLGIHKCTIFLFTSNVAGRKFWRRLGWRARPDIQPMQIRLADNRPVEEDDQC